MKKKVQTLFIMIKGFIALKSNFDSILQIVEIMSKVGNIPCFYRKDEYSIINELNLRSGNINATNELVSRISNLNKRTLTSVQNLITFKILLSIKGAKSKKSLSVTLHFFIFPVLH